MEYSLLERILQVEGTETEVDADRLPMERAAIPTKSDNKNEPTTEKLKLTKQRIRIRNNLFLVL